MKRCLYDFVFNLLLRKQVFNRKQIFILLLFFQNSLLTSKINCLKLIIGLIKLLHSLVKICIHSFVSFKIWKLFFKLFVNLRIKCSIVFFWFNQSCFSFDNISLVWVILLLFWKRILHSNFINDTNFWLFLAWT